MRRLVGLLCLAAAAAGVGRAYANAAATQVGGMIAAPDRTGLSFTLPVSPAFSKPNSAHQYVPLIERAADRTQVNIFRTAVGYTLGDRPQVVQYVFLTGPTRLFSAYALRNGHWLTPSESQGHSAFLSSSGAAGRDGEVGRLGDLVGLPVVYIRPFSDQTADSFAAGEYFVETPSAHRASAFLKVLSALLAGGAARTRPPTAPAGLAFGPDAPLPPNFAVPLAGIRYLLLPLQLALAVLMAVLLLYFGLAQGKRIGIMRLVGLGPVRIWWDLLGRLVTTVLVVAGSGVVIAAFLLDRGTFGLEAGALRQGLISGGLSVAATLVVLVYASRLNVPQAIKGNRRAGVVVTLNLGVKTGVLASGVLLSLTSWANATAASDRLAEVRSHRSYSAAFGQFGVFRQTVGMHMLDYIQEPFSSEAYIEGRWLYPYLVSRGAVLINASSYEPGVPADTLRVLTVNTNYLRAFPLRSPSGERIYVPDTKALVLLLPVSDRAQVGALVTQVQRERALAASTFPVPVSPALRHPPVRVLWYSDQRVQTLDPLVAPHYGSEVASPIIEVITLRNSTLLDRVPSLGGLDDPVKMPLAGSAAKTYARLLPELRSLHLAGDRSGLSSIRAAVFSYTAQLERSFLTSAATAACCVAMGLLLARASLSMIFARYQRRVIVRRLHGLSLVEANRELSWMVAATLLGEFAVCVAVASGTTTGSGSGLAIALTRVAVGFVVVSAVEVALSAVTVRRRERNAIAAALKRDW